MPARKTNQSPARTVKIVFNDNNHLNLAVCSIENRSIVRCWLFVPSSGLLKDFYSPESWPRTESPCRLQKSICACRFSILPPDKRTPLKPHSRLYSFQ